MSEDIILVDEGNNLQLYSYNSCANDDDDEKKKQRGVIKTVDGDIISLSLPYTNEYTLDNVPTEIIDHQDEYVKYPSIEGTLIRVFKYDGKLMITTNRKLDAFTSYWSSKYSYGQLFTNELSVLYNNHNVIMEILNDKIEEDKIYFFLLGTNNDNRIVCLPKYPSLYYIGYYNKNDQTKLVREGSFDKIPGISEINVDIHEYVKNVDPFEYQGIILFHKERNEQIKILNDRYKYFWSVRNNNSNLYMRYLELRNDPLLDDFFRLYPRMKFISDKIENNLFEISRIIYDAYVNRYIHKKYISLPKQEYIILKKAHDWHILDRENNKIYRQKIYQLLNDEKPYHLLQIIKRYKTMVI